MTAPACALPMRRYVGTHGLWRNVFVVDKFGPANRTTLMPFLNQRAHHVTHRFTGLGPEAVRTLLLVWSESGELRCGKAAAIRLPRCDQLMPFQLNTKPCYATQCYGRVGVFTWAWVRSCGSCALHGVSRSPQRATDGFDVLRVGTHVC
jgi:hypothetical protein